MDIISSVKNAYNQALQKLKQDKPTFSGSPYIEKAKAELKNFATDTLGIPKTFTSPISQNSLLGKFGSGVIKANQWLDTAPVISTIGKIPETYGKLSGEQIGQGIRQTFSGAPSTIPFTNYKVSGYIAGPAKIAMGAFGLTPAGIIGDYAMEGGKALATPVFGKNSLATEGVGLIAGVLAPGGEMNDARNAKTFLSRLSEVGSLELKALPKEERLSFLVNYGTELLKRGYKTEDINKIGAPQAFALIKNNITPATWATRAKNIATAKVPMALEGAKEAFQKWVNYRKAGDFEALAQKKAFQELDSQGLQGIIDFQAGKITGLEKVKQFFDSKYSELKNAGVKIGYRESYLPQLWANTKEEVDQVFNKTLNKNPSFSLERTIADYVTGMENGLTPRYNNISNLAGWYERTSNKALADRTFFDFLANKKFILPETKSPQGWVSLDTDLFPRLSTKIDDKVYSGAFKAEPELANLINNYLRTPEGPIASFAQLATRVKNIGLAGGIPSTAINYHGLVNIFRRDLLASGYGNFFRDLKWIAHPNSALDYVNANLDDASYFTKNGLTISAEDWDQFRKEVPTNLFGKIENKWDEWMGDPLFKKTLPAIKLSFAKSEFNYLKNTMPEAEAVKLASTHANEIFGGINLDELGRSKETQNFLRSVFLAPDWLETQLKIGAGIGKGLTHIKTPELKIYRTIAKNAVFNYLLENLANKLLSGHWMYENDGNNKTAIDTGTFDSNGSKRFLNTWGTAQDWARIPYQIMEGLFQGNIGAMFTPINNRLSLPLSAGAHLLTNQDYLHRPIYGKDNYGNPIAPKQQAGAIANELLNGLGIPVQVRSAIDYMSGRSSGEQSIVNSLELPVKYSGGAYSQKQIKTVQDLKSVGSTGAEINQALHPTKESGGGFLSNLFNKKQETAPSDPLMVALQKEQDLSDKQKQVRDIFAMNLSKDKTETLLQKNDLGSYEDNSLYMMRTLGVENGARPDYVKQILTGLKDDDFKKTVNYLAQNKVLTTSITSYWSDNGMISDSQKKTIDSLIKKANGKSTKKKFNLPNAPKVKSTVSQIKLRPIKKINTNSLKVVQPKL